MNLVALIGIVDKIFDAGELDGFTLKIKVEKNDYNDKEEGFNLIFVKFDYNSEFFNELQSLKTGDVVGIKGQIDSLNRVIGDKLQIF